MRLLIVEGPMKGWVGRLWTLRTQREQVELEYETSISLTWPDMFKVTPSTFIIMGNSHNAAVERGGCGKTPDAPCYKHFPCLSLYFLVSGNQVISFCQCTETYYVGLDDPPLEYF